jgi:hypothetical protein
MGRVLADTSSVEDDDTGPRGSARRILALAEVNGGGPGMAPRARRLLVSRGRAWASRHFGPGPRPCPPIIRRLCEQF